MIFASLYLGMWFVSTQVILCPLLTLYSLFSLILYFSEYFTNTLFHYLFSRILCPFFVSFDAVLNGTLPSLPSPAFVISNYRHLWESSGDSFEYANRFAFPSRWQCLKNQHRWWDCQLEWGTLTSVVIFVVEVVWLVLVSFHE